MQGEILNQEPAMLPRIRVMYLTALITALILAAAHGHAQLTAAPSTAVGSAAATGTAVAAAAPTR